MSPLYLEEIGWNRCISEFQASTNRSGNLRTLRLGLVDEQEGYVILVDREAIADSQAILLLKMLFATRDVSLGSFHECMIFRGQFQTLT